jgi:hypothetical protein
MSRAEIFVFGSNLMGIHGKGGALCALKEHGAVYGRGVGRQGKSYAIPTKANPIETLPLVDINYYVADFIRYARNQLEFHPMTFYMVTPIGCGLAGYKPKDIAPMFRFAKFVPTIILPPAFIEILETET